MPENIIRVEGIADLQRSFFRLSRDLGSGVREALESAAEPVRSDASALARTQISGMARVRLPWWRMRTGVTRTSVYIAPEQRGVKGGRLNDRKRRPNLVSVMGPRMEEALARNRNKVENAVLDELDELAARWGRNG